MGINYTFKLKSVLYYTQQLQKPCVIQSTIFIIEYINYHYKAWMHLRNVRETPMLIFSSNI